jgi:hypothetical protein
VARSVGDTAVHVGDRRLPGTGARRSARDHSLGRPGGPAATHPSRRRHRPGRPPVGLVVRRYLWYLTLAISAGVGAGILAAGAGGRLVMRLLAVTAGPDAQGRITEADQVVGRISLDGSLRARGHGGHPHRTPCSSGPSAGQQEADRGRHPVAPAPPPPRGSRSGRRAGRAALQCQHRLAVTCGWGFAGVGLGAPGPAAIPMARPAPEANARMEGAHILVGRHGQGRGANPWPCHGHDRGPPPRTRAGPRARAAAHRELFWFARCTIAWARRT